MNNTDDFFDVECSLEVGRNPWINPFIQKKLTAPAKNRNVSYCPITAVDKPDLVKTTPISISVEKRMSWKICMAETGVILKETGNLFAKVGLFYLIKITRSQNEDRKVTSYIQYSPCRHFAKR